MATLLAAYAFTEADGAISIADATGNGNTGTFFGTGSVTFAAGPAAGSKSLLFTGMNQSFRIPRTNLEPNAAAGGVTTMYWIKKTQNTTDSDALSGLFKQRANGSTRHGAYVDSQSVDGGSIARWKDQLSTLSLPGIGDGAWHHLCVVDGDTGYAMYVDGVQKGSGGRATNGNAATWEDYPWVIGKSIDPLNQSAAGLYIAEPRIFAGMLTPSEVVTWRDTRVTASGPPSGTGAISGTDTLTSVGGIQGNTSGSGALSGTDTLSAVQGGSSGALAVWQAAYAARATTAAKIVVVGDSVTEGQSATTKKKRYISLIGDSLRGSTNGQQYECAWYGVGGASPWSAEGRNPTGNLTYESVPGLAYKNVTIQQGEGITFTVTGTVMDILYAAAANTNSFSYKIDSGAPVTVTPSVGGYSVNQRVAGVSLGAAGTHNVTITAIGTGGAYIFGLSVYNGDASAGVHIYDSGHSGYKASDFNAQSALFQSALNTIAPDLIIVPLGLNDKNSQTAAQFQSNYDTLIASLKGLTKVPSILCVAEYVAANGGMAGFNTAVQNVATKYGCAFLDLSINMPQADFTGNGYYDSDGIHPNDSGHARMAQLMSPILSNNVSYTGSAALTGSDALSSTSGPVFSSLVALSGQDTLSVSGLKPRGIGAAALTGQDALTASAGYASTSYLTGADVLSPTGKPVGLGAADLTGLDALTVSGFSRDIAAAALSGIDLLTSTGYQILPSSAALSGQDTLSAGSIVGIASVAGLTGVDSLVAYRITLTVGLQVWDYTAGQWVSATVLGLGQGGALVPVTLVRT